MECTSSVWIPFLYGWVVWWQVLVTSSAIGGAYGTGFQLRLVAPLLLVSVLAAAFFVKTGTFLKATSGSKVSRSLRRAIDTLDAQSTTHRFSTAWFRKTSCSGIVASPAPLPRRRLLMRSPSPLSGCASLLQAITKLVALIYMKTASLA